MASAGPARLAYIDWMRGLACVLMFQTHCYDAWLREDARHGALLEWSQKLGTFPAPLFLFLAGISFALVVTKLRRKGLEASAIAEPRSAAERRFLRWASCFEYRSLPSPGDGLPGAICSASTS